MTAMNYHANPGNQEIVPDFDQSLIWPAVFLMGLGLVMVYSASIATAGAIRGSGGYTTYFLVRHGAYLMIGLIAGLAAFQVPMRVWQQYSLPLVFIGIGLLVLVLIPGIGREINGSRRWISLLVVNFQPSEFMKLFMVIYVADYTARKTAYLDNFATGLFRIRVSYAKGYLPILGIMIVTGRLLLMEPDFGAFVVITAIVVGILFLGGMNLRLFAGLVALLVVGLLALIWITPYRMQRMIGFLDPWTDPYGKGYQLSHALIAFGRGEWMGVGLGGSVEKLSYLPEAHTDFLLAVIAEELGFVGVAVVVVLFAWLVVRAFVAGRQAATLERNFSALVAQGVGIWLGVQAFINMGVNMGALPTKGLTLPLMSFGGSSIVVNCIALAILLRVDWENRQLIKGLPA